MRRHVAALAAAAVLAAGALQASPAQAAAVPLKFARFVADQPGNDLPVSKAKLNREYIQVTNTTAKAINLTGYTVRDNGNKHVYTFPKNFKLGARKTVTLHSGKGKNSATHLYWGMGGSYVWNNTGDTARLVNAKGKLAFSCVYKKVASGYKNC